VIVSPARMEDPALQACANALLPTRAPTVRLHCPLPRALFPSIKTLSLRSGLFPMLVPWYPTQPHLHGVEAMLSLCKTQEAMGIYLLITTPLWTPPATLIFIWPLASMSPRPHWMLLPLPVGAREIIPMCPYPAPLPGKNGSSLCPTWGFRTAPSSPCSL